ncbi:MAG TPA: hypothetical protein VF365_06865 [Candidatus Limnocylindria bacterium]
MTTPTAELVRGVFPDVEVREELTEFGSLMSGARAETPCFSCDEAEDWLRFDAC